LEFSYEEEIIFFMIKILIHANPMSYLSKFVIPACLEFFLEKDPGQARMTENWKGLISGGVATQADVTGRDGH